MRGGGTFDDAGSGAEKTSSNCGSSPPSSVMRCSTSCHCRLASARHASAGSISTRCGCGGRRALSERRARPRPVTNWLHHDPLQGQGPVDDRTIRRELRAPPSRLRSEKKLRVKNLITRVGRSADGSAGHSARQAGGRPADDGFSCQSPSTGTKVDVLGAEGDKPACGTRRRTSRNGSRFEPMCRWVLIRGRGPRSPGSS